MYINAHSTCYQMNREYFANVIGWNKYVEKSRLADVQLRHELFSIGADNWYPIFHISYVYFLHIWLIKTIRTRPPNKGGNCEWNGVVEIKGNQINWNRYGTYSVWTKSISHIPKPYFLMFKIGPSAHNKSSHIRFSSCNSDHLLHPI